MALSLTELTEEAMRLPVDLRTELIERLVGTLHEDGAEEHETAWAEEALRRLEEYRSGKVEAIPGAEVMTGVRRRAGK